MTHIVPSIFIQHSAFNIQHSSFVHSPAHQPIPPSIHSHSSLILNIQQLFGSDFVGFAFLFPFSVSPSSKSPCPSVLSVHSLKAVMRPLLPTLLPSFPLPYSFCFYITSSPFHSSHSRSSAAAAKFPLISRLSVSFTSSFDYLIMMIICSR